MCELQERGICQNDSQTRVLQCDAVCCNADDKKVAANIVSYSACCSLLKCIAVLTKKRLQSKDN